MARKKSLTAQLVQAYRDGQKAKAAELKRQEQEQARLERAAEQERRRRDLEKAKQERERTQEWERAQREARRLQEEQARQAEQVVRDLEKRQAAREREAEQQKRLQARRAAEAARLAKQQASEQLRQQAADRTAEVAAQVERLQTVLASRSSGLHASRLRVEEALSRDGVDSMVESVDGALANIAYPEGLRTGVWRSAFAPETRELMLEIDLPGQSVVPIVAQYRYKASAPPEVVPQPRKQAEVKDLYRTLVARLALRARNTILLNGPVPPSSGVTMRPFGMVRPSGRRRWTMTCGR
ncbi:hypothetical protein [Streptomyces jeddahensis]|uniref:Uncharacterized protein n=1 Tax=Streptomyces jeddahensis TaxID=1716141 RepID=A0A177HNB5_9ACTN|nr:hypothetical protein [Streptomyces jeddahensis]OAH11714.1 hypothetical protein STSP_48830 [Streptomyces jeddahensis]